MTHHEPPAPDDCTMNAEGELALFPPGPESTLEATPSTVPPEEMTVQVPLALALVRFST